MYTHNLTKTNEISFNTHLLVIAYYVYRVSQDERAKLREGRVFLMLKYTDITQNTYIQSWTVTEIMAREVW